MGPRALPLLERGHRPQPAKWYRLSPRGDRPRGRVGHGCLFLPGGGPGRVLLLGGADPAGAFADAHFVELGANRWAAAGWSGLRPRYEHATFLPAAVPPRLWVFGGAHPAGNRSCVQVLDLGEWEWFITFAQELIPLHGGIVLCAHVLSELSRKFLRPCVCQKGFAFRFELTFPAAG
uniref:Rab9 effector protein with kelch motifs n=1 Tax=Strix occidentalis caurina TaxID=311401 RepID=A0A8D0FAA4_STROC